MGYLYLLAAKFIKLSIIELFGEFPSLIEIA